MGPYSWKKVSPEILELFEESLPNDYKIEMMSEAIRIAESEELRPNIGAVIASGHKILASGTRSVEVLSENPRRYKFTHAEEAALSKLQADPGEELTLFATLEPCFVRGPTDYCDATAPCSQRIIDAGIRTVVVGLVDADHRTRGLGIEKMQKAGISVEYAYEGLEERLESLLGDGDFSPR